jgi:integrator complex subunit 3
MAFCCELWKSAKTVCLQAGRDIVRLFRDCGLAGKPALAPIWTDLNAVGVGGEGEGKSALFTLMGTRTPNKVLLTRVSPEMQNQLLFIMKNVKLGNQRRYQMWFANRYVGIDALGRSLPLTTPPSAPLSTLVRVPHYPLNPCPAVL